jgi:hypothetical protein
MQRWGAHLHRAVVCALKMSIYRTGALSSTLVAALVLIAPHQLPAPISEESAPTPSPEQSATPKPTPVAKSRATATPSVIQSITRKSRHAEKLNNATRDAKLSPVQPPKPEAPPSQSVFDGTWKGSINLVPARNWHGTGRLIGTFNVELQVAGDGTSVIEHCRNATVPERSERDGKTIRWQSNIFKDVSCSLTPKPDGKTALVMFRNDFYGEPTGIFEKSSSTP